MIHAENTGGINGFIRSRTGIALVVFLGIAAFFLLTEHTAHVFGYLPFALRLMCPLMHVFMHGGHGGVHGTHGDQPGNGAGGASR